MKKRKKVLFVKRNKCHFSIISAHYDIYKGKILLLDSYKNLPDMTIQAEYDISDIALEFIHFH